MVMLKLCIIWTVVGITAGIAVSAKVPRKGGAVAAAAASKNRDAPPVQEVADGRYTPDTDSYPSAESGSGMWCTLRKCIVFKTVRI